MGNDSYVRIIETLPGGRAGVELEPGSTYGKMTGLRTASDAVDTMSHALNKAGVGQARD
jgi:hypothetical protein